MASTGAGYDQSVNTYSPDGKLFQVDYAYKAIENSGTAVGVRCRDGIILGVEKLIASKLLTPGSGRRLHTVDEHLGVAVAGLMPDSRQLVSRARDEALGYRRTYGEAISPQTLNDRLGGFMHVYTQYWYLRPFGASLLLAGYDAEAKRHELYCVEPNGTALRYFGFAIGKGQRAAKTEIEKGHFEEKSCEEALGLVAKIIRGVHDDSKDKPFELELSWLCEASGWKHVPVPAARRAEADAWARARIEEEEQGDDDEDAEMAA